MPFGGCLGRAFEKILREVAAVWTACLYKQRQEEKLSRLYWTLPSRTPFWLFHVTAFKVSHCHFLKKKTKTKPKPLLAYISCYTWPLWENIFFTWADSKWDNIWTAKHFPGQYKLLKYGPGVWLKEMVSLYLLPPPPHPPQPVHSLWTEMYWKQVLLRSSLAWPITVYVLFSLLDLVSGHMDLFS